MSVGELTASDSPRDGGDVYVVRVGSLGSGDESLGKIQMKVLTFSE